jgi:hypothetical protein
MSFRVDWIIVILVGFGLVAYFAWVIHRTWLERANLNYVGAGARIGLLWVIAFLIMYLLFLYVWRVGYLMQVGR